MKIVARTDADAIQGRMLRNERFSAAEVSSWMSSDDVDVLGAAFQAIHALRSIDGDIEPDHAKSFLIGYLLATMQGHSASAKIFQLPPYLAGHELARLYKYWRESAAPADPYVIRVRDELARTYLAGNDAIKRVVVDGTLEHLFENPNCRADFADWESDERLRVAYEEAVAWVTAHPRNK